ncbi:MAG: MBL fold metallo-hydrolase [Candidatus Izemoplasmatales bacterium]
MLITSIVNDVSKEGIKAEHGLSLLIEMDRHNILFDSGKSDLVIENLAILNKDVKNIDYLIISHSHYDHTGGVKAFLENNEKAKILMQTTAFKDRYSQTKDGDYRFSGFDRKVLSFERLSKLNHVSKIDSSLLLFSNVSPKYPMPENNKSLFEKIDNRYVLDFFEDEQSAVLYENGKYCLISGCSHLGILNILEKAEELTNHTMDYVFGGFHLYSHSTGKTESIESIRFIASELKKRKTKYYTMHCTGLGPYQELKNVLADQIEYLYGGDNVKI